MVNSATAAMVGFTTGRNILNKITRWLAPSIIASSSKDFGTLRNAFIISIAFPKGIALGRISAYMVFTGFNNDSRQDSVSKSNIAHITK